MNTNSSKPRFPLFDEIDRGLNMLVKEVLQHEPRQSDSPRLSVYELEQSFIVECDLPGVDLSDIDIQLEDGTLEISGVRKTPKRDGMTVTVEERSFEAFNRKLQLGKDVNFEAVDAEFGNGVLKVTVPKADSAKSRQVKIRRRDEQS